jgi:hypothetical protein
MMAERGHFVVGPSQWSWIEASLNVRLLVAHNRTVVSPIVWQILWLNQQEHQQQQQQHHQRLEVAFVIRPSQWAWIEASLNVRLLVAHNRTIVSPIVWQIHRLNQQEHHQQHHHQRLELPLLYGPLNELGLKRARMRGFLWLTIGLSSLPSFGKFFNWINKNIISSSTINVWKLPLSYGPLNELGLKQAWMWGFLWLTIGLSSLPLFGKVFNWINKNNIISNNINRNIWKLFYYLMYRLGS